MPEPSDKFLKDFFTRGEEVEFFLDGVNQWVKGVVKYEMRPQRLYQVERPNGEIFLVPEHGLRRTRIDADRNAD